MVLQNADGSGRGPAKLRSLKDNSNYFRAALLRMGCTVLGDWDSPVMVHCSTLLPVLLSVYNLCVLHA